MCGSFLSSEKARKGNSWRLAKPSLSFALTRALFTIVFLSCRSEGLPDADPDEIENAEPECLHPILAHKDHIVLHHEGALLALFDFAQIDLDNLLPLSAAFPEYLHILEICDVADAPCFDNGLIHRDGSPLQKIRARLIDRAPHENAPCLWHMDHIS